MIWALRAFLTVLVVYLAWLRQAQPGTIEIASSGPIRRR